MQRYFIDCKVEKLYMLCMDAKAQLLGCREVAEGTVNATAVSVRKVVEVALAEGATAVILAHNHPSGLAYPSDEDVATTIQIERALAAVDVTLVDHLVMDESDFISMADSGRYKPRSGFVPIVR